jgi:hypothetical protein
MTLIRDMPKIACFPLLRISRRALSYSFTDWIAGWVHCSTNRRHVILDVRLLFDAPHENPGCRLHPGSSQDLTVALWGWRSHIQQHTHIETYIKPNEITHSIIFTNQKIHTLFISSNYYTKNNCHLTQSLYTTMKFSLWTNDLRHDERC